MKRFARTLPRLSTIFSLIVWPALLFLVLKSLARFWASTSDDAGISFAYAKNFFDGYGLVHSLGAEPVEGFSNPIWVFILGVFYWIGIEDLSQLSKIISAVAHVVSIIIAWLLPSKLQHRDTKFSDLFAPIWLGLSPVVLMWSTSGLENAILNLFLLLSLWFASESSLSVRSLTWCAVFMSGVILTRPEGIGYAFVLGAALWIMSWDRKNQWFKNTLVYWIIIAVTTISFYLGRYIYYDQWLPNTYYAKVGGARVQQVWWHLESAGFQYVWSYIKHFKISWFVLPLCFALMDKKVFRTTGLLALFIFSIFFPVYVGGDWMGSWRFLTPAIALSAPLLSMGIYNVCHKLAELRLLSLSKTQRDKLFGVLAICLCTAMIIHPNESRQNLLKKNPSPGWKLEENKRASESFSQLRTWLGLKRASLLIADVGAPSLARDLFVHDLGELCSRPLSRVKDPLQAQELMLSEQRPDFVAFAASWRSHRAVKNAKELAAGYIELPRSAKFPLWPWGYAGVRRELLVHDLPTPQIPIKATLGPIEILGLRALPRQLPINTDIFVEIFAKRISKMPKNTSIEVGIMPDDDSLKTVFFPVESGEGLYPVSKWALHDVVVLKANLKLSHYGKSKLVMRIKRENGSLLAQNSTLTTITGIDATGETTTENELNRIAQARKTEQLEKASEAISRLQSWLNPRQIAPLSKTFAERFLSSKESRKRSLRENRVIRENYTDRLQPLRKQAEWVSLISNTLDEERRALAGLLCENANIALNAKKFSIAFIRWQQSRRIYNGLPCRVEKELANAFENKARNRGNLDETFLDLLKVLALDPTRTAARGKLEEIRSNRSEKYPFTKAFQHLRELSRRLSAQPDSNTALKLFELWSWLGEDALISKFCSSLYGSLCSDNPELERQSKLARCRVWDQHAECL